MIPDLVFILLTVQATPTLPPLADRDRFPDKLTCESVRAFNSKYQSHCQARREWFYGCYCSDGRWQVYAELERETRQLYKVWDTLHDAHYLWNNTDTETGSYYYHDPVTDNYSYVANCKRETKQREALAHLRELLGEADYRWGFMPPPIPLWGLTPVD